jgi:hypothetical protein
MSTVVAEHAAEISAAYEDVRDDKTSTNWAVLDYEEGKDSVFVSGKGTPLLASYHMCFNI